MLGSCSIYPNVATYHTTPTRVVYTPNQYYWNYPYHRTFWYPQNRVIHRNQTVIINKTHVNREIRNVRPQQRRVATPQRSPAPRVNRTPTQRRAPMTPTRTNRSTTPQRRGQ
jgi:hypothetical protein